MDIEPRNNPYFIGHEKAESSFLDAFQRGTLHHALLIDGIEGIGKATFAYRIARFLLDQDKNPSSSYHSLAVSPTSAAFVQVASGSNPNFKVIERGYTDTDTKKIIKAIQSGTPMGTSELQDLKKSSVIKIDAVREMNDFLSKKSFDGSWRVVLIDSVDDLNTASSNAILKILEEPPLKTLLLLISHNPSTLLPTIRSRCVRFHLEPLSKENVETLLRRYMPELSPKAVSGLALICGGSIGKALKYASNHGLEIYEKLQAVFYKGSKFDLSIALELASNASSNDDVWDLTIDLILEFISKLAHSGTGGADLMSLYNEVVEAKDDVLRLNLDKRQTLICLLDKIAKVTENAC